jgi:Na+-driven multidrug efflux pump
MKTPSPAEYLGTVGIRAISLPAQFVSAWFERLLDGLVYRKRPAWFTGSRIVTKVPVKLLFVYGALELNFLHGGDRLT